MTDEERALTVLLRHVQWALDDMAHDLPAGRVTAGQRAELVDMVTGLLVLLRGEVVPPTVIDLGAHQPDARGQ